MGKSIEASVTQWNTLFKFHPCPPETENYAGCAERYASYETTRTARDVRDPAGAEHLHRNSNPAMSQLQGHTLGTIGVQLAAQVAQGAADASREDVCSPALLPSPEPRKLPPLANLQTFAESLPPVLADGLFRRYFLWKAVARPSDVFGNIPHFLSRSIYHIAP